MEKTKKGKKGIEGFKVPDTYILVVMFVIIGAILTYIIPAGEYDMIENVATGRTVVDPTTFHNVAQNPVSLMTVLLAFPKGLSSAQGTIFMVLLVGGFFQIINSTGATDRVIGMMVKKLGDKDYLVVPIVMILMALGGAVGAIANSVIAFIPIGLLLARKLKLDPIIAVAVMYLGAYSGFGTSPISPQTVQLAQKIAEIPPVSGFTFRLIISCIVVAVSIIYTMVYAAKVKKNPANSYMTDFQISVNSVEQSNSANLLPAVDILIVSIMFGCFVLFTYGTLNWQWGTDHLSAIMFATAVICGVIGKMTPQMMVKAFGEGCRLMTYGAILIGFASAISGVLTEGKIIHTIIYNLCLPLTQVGSTLSAVLMYYVNLVFNFFVPSGSGQAAIVMPLMAPMADVLGMTRQMAVSAFQYGDGLSNMIIPTGSVLMASIGAAGVPYNKWLKFMFPLFIIHVIITTIGLMIGVAMGIA